MLMEENKMAKRKGRKAQQARFRKAAKSCKGKPNYRKCMSKHLKK